MSGLSTDWLEETEWQLNLASLKKAGGDSVALAPKSYTDIETLASKLIQSSDCRDDVISRFVFVEDHFVNGKAFECRVGETGLRIATLNTGAVLGIREFFYYLLSRCDVLPDIGRDIGHNLSHIFHPQKSFPVLKHLYTRHLVSNILPRNQVRRSFASVLASLALQFLTIHELMHVQCGHVSLNGNLLQAEGHSWEITRHTLEISADSLALDYLTKCCRGGGYSALYQQNEWFLFTEPFSYAYPLLLAVNLLFLLLAPSGTVRDPVTPLRTGLHPTFSSRAFNASAIAGTVLAGKDPSAWNLFKPVATKALHDAIKIWTLIAGEDSRPFWGLSRDKLISPFSHKENYRYVGELMTHWGTLRPKLEPHSLLPLPPIEAWDFERFREV